MSSNPPTSRTVPTGHFVQKINTPPSQKRIITLCFSSKCFSLLWCQLRCVLVFPIVKPTGARLLEHYPTIPDTILLLTTAVLYLVRNTRLPGEIISCHSDTISCEPRHDSRLNSTLARHTNMLKHHYNPIQTVARTTITTLNSICSRPQPIHGMTAPKTPFLVHGKSAPAFTLPRVLPKSTPAPPAVL